MKIRNKTLTRLFKEHEKWNKKHAALINRRKKRKENGYEKAIYNLNKYGVACDTCGGIGEKKGQYGGIIHGGSAFCPDCEKDEIKWIKINKAMIQEYKKCPKGLTFVDFVWKERNKK